PVGQVSQGGLELAAVTDVALERGLGGDRLGRLASVNRRAVAALRVSLQHRTTDPERLDQSLRLISGKLADRADAHGVQPLLGLGSQPGYDADRQRREKVSRRDCWDRDEAVPLEGVASDP